MITGKRYLPEAAVSFYTEEGEIVARTKPSVQGKVINSDIINITTSNDLNADAGTFQVTLVARNRWDKVLAANDLVIIRMKRAGEDTDTTTVMVGLIDDVRKITTVQGNTPQREIVVTGRNFAKVLINFEVGVVQEVEMTESSLGWIGGRVTFAGKSSAEIIKQIFDVLIFKYANYKFNNGKTLKDMIKLDLSSRPGEKLMDDTSFVNYQGSMNSFLREIVDEPFNQMFWDCEGDQPKLVVRETPFNESAWKKLPLHELTDEDIIFTDIGRSDIETYTLFSVGLQNYFSGFDVHRTLGVKPLWYEKYFDKYGLRRLHRFTAYVGFGGDEGGSDASAQLKKYQEDLFNWNILNPQFYNGFVSVVGKAKYKVGDRIIIKSYEHDDEIEFFVESVQQEFINNHYWVTKMGVTRGLGNRGLNRFMPPWGEFKEYEGGALGTPSAGDIGGGGGLPIGGGAPVGTGKLSPSAVSYYFKSPFRITSRYGSVSSVRRYRPHTGTDFAAPSGTKIISITDGVVDKAGYAAGSYGNYIYIRSGNMQIRYAHMRNPTHLRKGQSVTAGQVIGYVGSTGNSTGPHLHLEILINGSRVDPEKRMRAVMR